MRKLNKNFLTFTFTTLFLGISMFLIIYKLSPAFFSHTVYYCQQLINSYSVKIPEQINLALMTLVTIIVTTFLTRVIVTFIKIRSMRNHLIKNEKNVKGLAKVIEKVGLKKGL